MQTSMIQACVQVLAREFPGSDYARYERIVRALLSVVVNGYFAKDVQNERNQNA